MGQLTLKVRTKQVMEEGTREDTSGLSDKKGLKYLLLRKRKGISEELLCYMRVKITENEDKNIHQFTVE